MGVRLLSFYGLCASAGRAHSGAIDLFSDSRVAAIAAFPIATELSPGRFVTFSDAIHGRVPQPSLLHFLAARLDLPGLAALDPMMPEQRMLSERHPATRLRDLFWYPPDAPPVVARAAVSYLPSIQWLVARADPADADGLVLAVKGGTNAEPHNQNDIGTFMVHWRGESLLTDLGAGRYVRDYFDPVRRYTFLTNRSSGHNVPLVNGVEQGAGEAFAARDVRQLELPDGAGLALELSAAYPPEAGLHSLRRSVLLRAHPAPGRVELRDQVRFTKDGECASVLISFAEATVIARGLIALNGATGRLLLRYDAYLLTAAIERVPGVELKRSASRDVTRITLALRQPAPEAELYITVEPLQGTH
ncbi:hypothetical protein HC891_16845 [Candidatus Gracilibacteria bacterium]|nr:hypothetical protein [Candidatus Gracilibacteria bacterium]